VLRRWLTHHGYQVRFIRNITDIDDKVLVRAVEEGRPFWSIAYRNELVLGAAYRTLGVLPPTYEPRATGHIPEMQELIGKLVESGHAYPAADGSGDVYFDVRSYPEYGRLSGQKVDQMEAAADAPERAKRDPRDFALWKGPKPDEPDDAYWDSPWGRGRPGWHIECSAMCRRYLGAEFDIHGGGLDLVFPHHENEIAQSRAAGLPFARYWLHNGMLNLEGAKMAKSVGNVLNVDAIVALGVRPVELRYYLIAPHYRSTIDYSEASLREAAAGYQRLEGFVHRAVESFGGRFGSPGEAPGAEMSIAVEAGELPEEFTAALDDDLNTSRAFAVLHDTVRAGNVALDSDGDVKAVLGQVRAMLAVLGLDPLDPHWAGTATDLKSTVDSLVALALEQRELARKRKDWAAADAVRDQLNQAGVTVEDTPHGPRWSVRDAR
jgi:cysteinyl-tRNA synthetase